jgi:hypothetical protein
VRQLWHPASDSRLCPVNLGLISSAVVYIAIYTILFRPILAMVGKNAAYALFFVLLLVVAFVGAYFLLWKYRRAEKI